MRRGVLVAFAILGLTACGRSDQGTAAVSAPASASPYTATCLEMAEAENWGEASRLCAMALSADPKDAKVRAALDAANAALSTEPKDSSAVTLESGEAMGESADDAAEDAQQGPPN